MPNFEPLLAYCKDMTRLASLSGLALIAGFWSWLIHPPATEPPQPPAAGIAVGDRVEATDPRAAILRALPVLEQDALAWFEGRTAVQDGTGCVSCHQVPFGVWGLQAAERAGISHNEEITADLTRRALDFIKRPRTARAMSWSPMVLAAGAQPPSTAGFTKFLLESQTGDGYWEARGQFPGQRRGIEETNAIATMWTLLALARVADATPAELDDPDLTDSLARAFHWARESSPGTSTEWLLLAPLVEQRYGDLAGSERSAFGDGAEQKLLAQQNDDGGWGWLPGEDSNPLSTGQVLYALEFEGPPVGESEHAASKRAVRYLLDSQGQDGFWRMSSALTSKETSADKDYFYAYWATAWATIGLSQTLLLAEPDADPAS